MTLVRFQRILAMGATHLWQHKARTALTMLGIIFGVCSVVSMLSVGEGASQEIQEKLRRLGSSNILIQSAKLPDEQLSGGQSESNRVAEYGLTYQDTRDLERHIPWLQSITPMKVVTFDVRYKDRKTETDVVATVPWFPNATNHRLLDGRFFAQTDYDAAMPVCVIGAQLARRLFVRDEPLGKKLRVDQDIYQIIGIMGDVDDTADFIDKPLWFMGQNRNVYLPLKSYRQRMGDMFFKFGGGSATFERVELHEMVLTLDSQEHVMDSAEIVRRVLARNHERKDYEIVVPLQLIRQTRETQRLFNIVLGSIAAISLVVGGIGIMNIMLATVSERTREIGVRRALGAKKHDIVMQFLVETLILSIAGGVIGLLIGAGIPAFITAVTGVRTVLTVAAFTVAFFVSVSVGLIFGIYPARRAARMDPIEALRHE